MRRNKITVKKIDFKQLEAIHEELELFSKHIAFSTLKTDFLNAIMSLDISNNLYFKLRNKLENGNFHYTISFTPSEAALILKCSNYKRPERNTYIDNVFTQLSFVLDQQLKSLI
jgi:hypothetical protein